MSDDLFLKLREDPEFYRSEQERAGRINSWLAAEVGRSCRSCTECCKSLGVNRIDSSGTPLPDEFLSKPGEWCEHCDIAKGCKIYDDPAKPRECDAFFCGWRLGFLPEDQRPDRSKVVAAGEVTSYGETMMIWERYPGVAEQNRHTVAFVSKVLNSGLPVIIASGEDRRKIILPESFLNKQGPRIKATCEAALDAGLEVCVAKGV